MNKPKYVVVQEWIHHAQLFQLKDHSSEMTQHSVMDNNDYKNNYWVMMLCLMAERHLLMIHHRKNNYFLTVLSSLVSLSSE